MPPRAAASPWGRIRPPNLDSLDSYGLVSRGDNRLLDHKAQELFYTKIVERYLAFCTDAKDRDALLEQFASLNPTGAAAATATATATNPKTQASSRVSAAAAAAAATVAPTPPPPRSSATATSSPVTANKDLSAVLMALRKLREGIVGSKRTDDFSVQAYLFCIRLGILAQHSETYFPALQHLLGVLHPRHPLTAVEFHEALGYMVLDAACRRGELALALRLRTVYRLRSPDVHAILKTLLHDDYAAFRSLLRRVNHYHVRLMEHAEEDMRRLTLKCLGRAYLHLDHVAYVENLTGVAWPVLQEQYGVGWERDGDRVIIRKPKRAAPAAAK